MDTDLDSPKEPRKTLADRIKFLRAKGVCIHSTMADNTSVVSCFDCGMIFESQEDWMRERLQILYPHGQSSTLSLLNDVTGQPGLK